MLIAFESIRNMKKIINFFIFCCFTFTCRAGSEISVDLQQKISFISEQIKYAHEIIDLPLNDTYYYQANLLLEIECVHYYLLNEASDFLPYFADFYIELLHQLDIDIVEENLLKKYTNKALHSLILALQESADIVKYYADFDKRFIQHTCHIITCLHARVT